MKVPKQVSLKHLAVIIISTILLTSFAFYVFAATPSSTFVIESGVYPGAPAYTVWQEGSNFFAKDVNGEIEFSGANESTVIQNALDASGRGDTIILRGVFTLDVPIQIKHSGLRLIGVSGWTLPQTEIKYSGADYAIKVRHPSGNSIYGYEISHIYIDGLTTGYGIELYNCHWGAVHHVYFINTVIAMKVMGAWESEIHNNQFRSPTNRAIWIDGYAGAGSHHVNIHDNYIDGAPYGIIIDDDANNPINIMIEYNDFGLTNNTDGVFVNYKTRGLKLIENYFEGATNIENSTGIVLNGNSSKPMRMTVVSYNSFITPNIGIYVDYAFNVSISYNYMFGYGGSYDFLFQTGNEEDLTDVMNVIET